MISEKPKKKNSVPAQNQPRSQIMFYKNCSWRDWCIMILMTTTGGGQNSTSVGTLIGR